MRPEPRSADPLSENLRHPGQAPDGTVVLHRLSPLLSSDSTAADYDAWPLGSPPQAANRSRHHPAALAIRPNRWARNDAGANAGRPHPPGRLLRRPHFRRRRKQVGCCLFRTTGRHGATLRPAAHRGNGLGEKENQVLFTPTGYRGLDSDLSDISPIWDSLESFSFSWRASFCPRLGSCCFFLPNGAPIARK